MKSNSETNSNSLGHSSSGVHAAQPAVSVVPHVAQKRARPPKRPNPQTPRNSRSRVRPLTGPYQTMSNGSIRCYDGRHVAGSIVGKAAKKAAKRIKVATRRAAAYVRELELVATGAQ